MVFSLIAEQTSNPWWITVLTGSGGALFVQFLWIKNLSDSNKAKDKVIIDKDKELMEISKESIECITKILERQNQDRPWKERLEKLIDDIHKIISKKEEN